MLQPLVASNTMQNAASIMWNNIAFVDQFFYNIYWQDSMWLSGDGVERRRTSCYVPQPLPSPDHIGGCNSYGALYWHLYKTDVFQPTKSQI